MFGGGKKDKGFSSKDKIQRYHGDGTESIIVMGKPFRVLQKLSDQAAPYMTGARHRIKHVENTHASYVFLVENSSRLSEFPRHLALKRSFFPVDQVTEAHKEIEIMSRIKDKNIVRVYHSEISRSEGKLGVSIAMEYCGNNLYRRIRSGSAGGAGTRLSESEICHVLLAVTSALGYLHSQQPPIAHRDIRPENILINNNATGPAAYKVCNFSSATTDAYQCETREEASMAINDIEFHTNPAFRSPEMADPWSKKRICEKSDMWSLGVLVYFMMFLKLPFEPTNMALSNNPKVKFPASGDALRYSGSLRLIVEHLLDPNPETRWDVFSLTNFLRFDEDVSRHLGTFCFTRTEYPEGWEEQDVKVLNREQPSKPPPVTYSDEGVHMHVDEDRRAMEEQRMAVATGRGGEENSNVPASAAATSTRARPSPSTGGSRSSVPPSVMADDAVREAMMVLGGGDDDDPEMAEYRRQIIKEQEEAWARLKAQTGRKDDTASQSSPTQQQQQQPPEPAPAPKKDLFDDLFAGPAEPQPPAQNQPAQAASTTASPNPAPQQQQRDVFSADDLFAAPAMPPHPMQQQQQQQATMMGGGYGGYSAAPPPGFNSAGSMGYGAGAMLSPPQQQQQPQAFGGAHNNGQYTTAFGGWGSGAPAGMAPPPQPWNTGAPPQQQQQQQPWGQGNGNFMAPAPGQQASSPSSQADAPPATAVSAKKKDPFADLFF